MKSPSTILIKPYNYLLCVNITIVAWCGCDNFLGGGGANKVKTREGVCLLLLHKVQENKLE